MSVDNVLARLDGVKQVRPGYWKAKCPAHDDRRPSLSVTELPDGQVLLYDFGGCTIDSVLGAAGLQMGDLFPEKPLPSGEHAKQRRTTPPIPYKDILETIQHELEVVAVAAAEFFEHGGFAATQEDHDRLQLAITRLRKAARVGRG